MADLFAATGDSVAHLKSDGAGWTVSRALVGSGAQCLARATANEGA
jgi:hypothetical protein